MNSSQLTLDTLNNSSQLILDTLNDSIRVKQEFISSHVAKIETAVSLIVKILKQGNKLLIFGNGGSAADAQHMAAEFINRFQMERPPMAALALTTDTSVITSIGNDYSFEDIFLKQIQALGKKGDIALCITTSGSSPNVMKAAIEAKSMGLHIIGLSGNRGKLKEMADIAFCVNSEVTARIQESHITLIHILCDLTERSLN
ncbi:MAG: D-sedoheptulose 7-phosphate isomerase [Desulfamplus sp.]|nr:D-sedoheptulose 7-phosphate isomerase [Desulfamplus sp.]